MATENYFDRIRPRRSLGGFYASLSYNDRRAYSSIPSRRLRQHYLHDTNLITDKVLFSLSSSLRSPSTPIPTSVTESSSFAFSSPSSPSSPSPSPSSSSSEEEEQEQEQAESVTLSSFPSQMSSPHYQSSIDLMASSLKCDDCHTHDGLFQCCHCNQRLCIRCCNKHYKSVTVELERLHELSDRLVAKIVHTKNDLERQKNETLEQCHKWRIDTINTINKAHALIVQTIHEEYETLGKEYELFVQKEMKNIHIDQNELLRMRKGNRSSVSSCPLSSFSSTLDSKTTIDTIRKRIEAFAKTIDETGKFLFQVKLPTFDIDDNLRVESRFGDVTRSTCATWQNGGDLLSASIPNHPIEEDESLSDDVQSTETNISLSNNKSDIIINTDDNNEKESNKLDEQELDTECRTTNSSSLSSSPFKYETNSSNTISPPSSRYALSVENDIELQQQQFYSPRLLSDRFDSAYGTAPSSPSNLNHNHYFSTSSLYEQTPKKSTYPSKNEFGSFYNNRRHTHAFQRTSSPPPAPPSPTPSYSPSSENFYNHKHNDNDNEDTYRSVQHVQLKCEQDGSLEGIAIKIEQSHNTEGMIERRRTCMQACGVRRRTTIISPRSPSSSTSNTDGFSYDQPWLHYRANSTPSFTQ